MLSMCIQYLIYCDGYRDCVEELFRRCVVKMKVLEPKLEALRIKGLVITSY